MLSNTLSEVFHRLTYWKTLFIFKQHEGYQIKKCWILLGS